MADYYAEGWMDAEDCGYAGPGWYFWDETQSNCYGPYETKEIAEAEQMRYIRIVLNGELE